MVDLKACPFCGCKVDYAYTRDEVVEMLRKAVWW